MSADVQGLRSLMAKLQQAKVETRGAMEREVRSTLHDMVDEARDLVPYLSGELHDSLTYEVDTGALDGRAGTNSPYSRAIEFGYRGSPPQPYLHPAAKKARRRMKARLTRRMNAALREVAQ